MLDMSKEVSVGGTREQTAYNGKAIVLNVWCYNNVVGQMIHGKYIIGSATITNATSTSKVSVNKFAEKVTLYNTGHETWTTYADIFEI